MMLKTWTIEEQIASLKREVEEEKKKAEEAEK